MLIALTDPASPRREADYHAWYNEVQIPPFLEMDGVLRVARYRTSAAQLVASTPAPHQYVALYDLAPAGHDGLARFADRQYEAYTLGKVGNRSRGSDAYNQESSRAIYYRQVGARAGLALTAAATSALLLAYSGPEGGETGEADAWQSDDLVFSVLSVRGFLAATRYAITELNVGRQFKPWPVPRRRLTVYEIDAPGADALAHALDRLTGQVREFGRIARAAPENGCLTQSYELIAGPFYPRPRAQSQASGEGAQSRDG